MNTLQLLIPNYKWVDVDSTEAQAIYRRVCDGAKMRAVAHEEYTEVQYVKQGVVVGFYLRRGNLVEHFYLVTGGFTWEQLLSQSSGL